MAKARTASRVAKVEGKKSQASIGNIRETLKAFEQVVAQDAFDLGGRFTTKSNILAETDDAAQVILDRLWRKADREALKKAKM